MHFYWLYLFFCTFGWAFIFRSWVLKKSFKSLYILKWKGCTKPGGWGEALPGDLGACNSPRLQTWLLAAWATEKHKRKVLTLKKKNHVCVTYIEHKENYATERLIALVRLLHRDKVTSQFKVLEAKTKTHTVWRLMKQKLSQSLQWKDDTFKELKGWHPYPHPRLSIMHFHPWFSVQQN